MQVLLALAVAACAQLAVAYPYPSYYPYYYGSNVDSLSYGSTDQSGAMVLSRYYQPYYNPRMTNGMASFMYQPQQPSNQYYQPDKRQTSSDLVPPPPPQQNEVYYPQVPEEVSTTPRAELTDSTDKTEIIFTTPKTIPEITEPEVEDVEVKPKKRVSKTKKRPLEDDDGADFIPKMPGGVLFPMFFGYGRSAGGAPGITAVANAYSTGRGGVASSHATAYGPPNPEFKYRSDKEV